MLEVKLASREPIALHCPVMENGAAPGRPICPVSSARLQIALTVAVPMVLWFTPMVQPMNAGLGAPVKECGLENDVLAQAGDGGHALGRVALQKLVQFLESRRVLRDVVAVDQVVAESECARCR